MSTTAHRFVWYELVTSDISAAAGFYQAVVGWDAHDAGMADRAYTLFSVAKTWVAGLMALPSEAGRMGLGPTWIGYVGVDDLDAFIGRVKQAGGAVHREPAEIPGVGRLAVVADPQGASFVLFSALPGTEAPAAAPGTPGHTGWHELRAADAAAAFDFYAGLFGWTKAEAIDMGAMGVYQMFATGGVPIGGMVTRPPQMQGPGWLYYFNVPKIEAAVERLTAAGGQLLNGPHQVPGGSWIIHGLDPQGALFALVAPPGS